MPHFAAVVSGQKPICRFAVRAHVCVDWGSRVSGFVSPGSDLRILFALSLDVSGVSLSLFSDCLALRHT